MAKKSKKKAEAKPEAARIYLAYSETRRDGEVCEGQENEKWPSYEPSYIDVDFQYLFRNPRQGVFCDSFEVSPELLKKDRLYMAVIRYSDGDTFGSSDGHWSVKGIFETYNKAQEHLEYVRSDKYTGYKEWEGYFSGFSDAEVVSLHVED